MLKYLISTKDNQGAEPHLPTTFFTGKMANSVCNLCNFTGIVIYRKATGIVACRSSFHTRHQ